MHRGDLVRDYFLEARLRASRRRRIERRGEHAGLGGRVSFERAGVPRSVAMSIVGHKTESIYRRYAIVDEAMQREAAVRLDAWAVSPRPVSSTVTVTPFMRQLPPRDAKGERFVLLRTRDRWLLASPAWKCAK